MAPIVSRSGWNLGFGRRRSVGGGVAGFSATGGTVTAAGITPGNGYRYHVFTGPGTFTVSSGTTNIEYLVVAGGGTAGGNGAGGGAGGLRTNVSGNPKAGAALPISPGSYTITVGGAGSPGPSLPGSGTPGPAGNGGYSAFADGSPNQIRSDGGGCGGNPGGAAIAGGSGGGGGGFSPTPYTSAGSGNTPPTSPSQGNPGGTGCTNCPFPSPGSGYTAAGGGGAGNTGGNASYSVAGSGGAGHPISAFAAPLIQPEIPAPNWSAFSSAVGPTGLYAGGGGGGGYGGLSTPGTGGPGGGGAGGVQNGSSFAPGQNGTTYTGGGGGGATSHLAQDGGGTPGIGGPGIVIIRYPA